MSRYFKIGENKKNRFLIFGLAAAVSLSACGKNRPSEEDNDNEAADPRAELDVTNGTGNSVEGEVPNEGRMAPPEGMQEVPISENIQTPVVQDVPDEDMLGDLPLHVTGTPEADFLTSEFSTWYGSSSPARCGNIERAAELLNGTVIEPGEVFSCAAGIGPITEDNGYLPAGTFVQGKVEQGIGGGVCQVSTTLYNAALFAGLTIVERAPHSMVVGYVEPARDAAIAGNYKDLKLRNDYNYPVMIEAITDDGTLYFRIHTSEEDVGNTVELVSVIIEEILPSEPVLTVDESLPEDAYNVTQKAHTGYQAELYRVVSRDGIEILREKVNTSYYAATPEYATVGSNYQTVSN